MRSLHRITAVVLFLLLVGGSVAMVLYSPAETGLWKDVVTKIASNVFLVRVAGGMMFALVVVYLLTGLSRRTNDKFLSFPNEGGTISVSVKGIESFISKLSDEFEAVKSLNAEIIPGDGSIDVVLNARIKDGVQIHEICQLLQARVKGSVKESLGVAEVRTVKVNVREIVSGRRVAWEGKE